MKNDDISYYNTYKAEKQSIIPCTQYRPNYDSIWGNFEIDYSGEEPKIALKAYLVNPYSTVENIPSFKIPGIYGSIIYNKDNTNVTEDTNVTEEITIKQVYTADELPEKAHLLFKRGYFNAFYKSDYPNYEEVVTTISFQYDFENYQFDSELASSPNYTTQIPLIRKFIVDENTVDDFNFALTSQGFISYKEDIVSYKEAGGDKLLVSKYLQEMFIKDSQCPVVFIPFILDEDYAPDGYYIPKDYRLIFTTVNTESEIQLILDAELSLLDYISVFNIEITDAIVIAITADVRSVKSGKTFTYTLLSSNVVNEEDNNCTVVDVIDQEAIIIPKEKYYDIDVPRLIKTYTPHSMFNAAPQSRQFLIDILQNEDALSYILTRSNKFIDDNVNKNRNYIDKLLSMLHSLGNDTSAYEQSSFTGVNELRDFTRILSMNHSEIIGNMVNEEYDISWNNLSHGDNIGNKININDIITLDKNNRVIKINDAIVENPSEYIVVRENYSNKTKLVSFHSAFPDVDSEHTVTFDQYWDQNIDNS